VLNHADLNTILQNLSQFLDIPESHFERTRDRYQAIGNWLERNDSTVSRYKPEIYPQGSFRLGTVIKPLSNKDEYDIDLVCKLHISKGDITQKRLKEVVGSELAKYVFAHQMNHRPEERRRSWRLNYSDGAQFHLDVLPSLPERFYQSSNEIAITDNQMPNYVRICNDWVSCNPVDYADWFKKRMEVRFQIMQKELAESFKADRADVPDYKVKTPLQRVVQILKRHRDLTFEGNPDDKPISILITTLAAHAYDNEADTLDALVAIVTKMSNFIEEKNGVLWVANPVNPSENFADKWTEYPQRQEIFLDWLTKVEIGVLEAVNAIDLYTATKSLERQFSELAINEALKGVSGSTSTLASTRNIKALSEMQSAFLVPHRQTPVWEMRFDPRVHVELTAIAGRNGFRPKNYFNNGTPLAKNTSLRFSASTNAKKGYSVYWQVVNNGDEAYRASSLRGGFYETSEIVKGKRIRIESTLYIGTHWVECFIIEQGVCVARSGEFVVNIA
jgi:hypothetical protein